MNRRELLLGSAGLALALSVPYKQSTVLATPDIPSGLGIGTPHQYATEVGDWWYQHAVDMLHPEWWINWKNDRVGDPGYYGMAWGGIGDGFFKLNEPEREQQANVLPEEAAAMSHDWERPWSGPGVFIGVGEILGINLPTDDLAWRKALAWIRYYLDAGGELPDYWNTHFYSGTYLLKFYVAAFKAEMLGLTGVNIPLLMSEIGDSVNLLYSAQDTQDLIDSGELVAGAIFSTYYKPIQILDLLTAEGELTKIGQAFVNRRKRRLYMPQVYA